MSKTLLGNIRDFTKLPCEIVLNRQAYFLNKVDDQFRLFTSICPHQGGQIFFEEESHCFKCDIHQWKFDCETGESYTSKKQTLDYFHVSEEGTDLYADLPNDELELIKEPIMKKKKSTYDKRPSIKLHAHACIEFRHKGFSLLCDPWINGPAFMGSWIQYPPPVIRTEQLNPNAIWISHEHSDHFHEPTLRLFNRSIPIYVPDFVNRRLIYKLEELGFEKVIAVPFGAKMQISDGLSITLFEPESLWNDALILIETADFKFLNLNDAGINHKIPKLIGPVDMIASSFSPGASGYPITWDHLDMERKEEIMVAGQKGMLSMLMQAMKVYGAKYLLPFASHFELWHPSQKEYASILKKNSLDDVVNYFRGSNYKVIDLLPGEEWDGRKDAIHRYNYNRKEIYNKLDRLKYVENIYDEGMFSDFHPKTSDISLSEIEHYFLLLNDVPEILFCEDIVVQLDVIHQEEKLFSTCFQIRDGKLSFLYNQFENQVNLTMQVPQQILAFIVATNESWDEATIGYWCKFSRNPDVYHAGFWRLLQAPYFKKRLRTPTTVDGISKHMVIADLMETYGEQAGRIFGRYGLYCFGCHNSVNESIEIGAKSHGLSPNKINKLIQELKRVLG
ncbi:MBL fold metallo-hydrolase [Alkalicoccobacillus murimartini]|uniref:Cytidine monophosphate-N-acetylneuraminic acid hydroxylase n=1 Tax=Alkalicoccobacillus murimartini TaxID=171685 RepID=A0ABT9YGE7_9BACI|nr:MBL fold metallo-hydrolase [Alkalicoccobacillus murimartini]MDQ0206933.1 CMP-N-acetylneuraminate monooxygenase [Alkalicoccobacillus murimartini]